MVYIFPKFHEHSPTTFWVALPTEKQINKQTNHDQNIIPPSCCGGTLCGRVVLSVLAIATKHCSSYSHTRTVVRECCKDDDERLREGQNLTPPHPKPLNRSSLKFASVCKKAEPIEMPFGLWARMVPRNHVLDASTERRCHSNQFWDAICYNWL